MSDSIIIGVDRSYTAMKTAYISYSIAVRQSKDGPCNRKRQLQAR